MCSRSVRTKLNAPQCLERLLSIKAKLENFVTIYTYILVKASYTAFAMAKRQLMTQ
jgi:hypothetical protein